ncbi:MAG: YfhO family protein [bacterium]
MKTNKDRAIAAIFFLIIAAWFLRGVVFRGEVFMAADALWNYPPWDSLTEKPFKPHNALLMDSIQTFYPAYAYSSRWLSAGHVPLWNPNIMCGVPYVASGDAELFYPITAAFFLAGKPEAAFGWNALLHLFLAGLFMYSLLRVIGAGKAGSIFGGLAFMFNGWLVGWMMLPGFLHSAIWLPLMVCLYELSLKRKRALYAMLGGVAGAMPFLTGNAQVGAYAHLFLGAYAAYRVVRGDGGRPRAVAYWLLGAGAAFALSAPQVLPMLDLMQRSQRPVAESISSLMKSPFQVKHLIMAFLPNFYGDPVNDNYWGTLNYSSLCLYMGVIPAVLALGAAVFGRMRDRLFFLFAAAAALLLALGTPLNIIFAPLPGLNRLPPFRIIYLFTFAVSVLAGMGLENLIRAGAAERKKWAGLWAVYLLAFVACAAVAIHQTPGSLLKIAKFERDGLMILFAFTITGLAVFLMPKLKPNLRAAAITLLVFLDIGLWASWYNQPVNSAYIYPMTPSIGLMQKDRGLFRVHAVGDSWILFPNSAMYYGLFDIRGIESLYPSRYLKLVDKLSERNFGFYNGEPNLVDIYGYDVPLIDFMNVRYILTKEPIARAGDNKYIEAPRARLKRDDARVTINRGAMLRFFGMSRLRALKNEDAVLDAVTSRRFAPYDEVLLNGEEFKGAPGVAAPKPGESGYVRLKFTDLIYKPDDISFTVDAPRPAMLVSSEANDAGWIAEVNGKPSPIYTANYHFRATPIPAGSSEVAFRYRPAPVARGVAAGLSAALFLFAVVLTSLWKRK